MAVASWEECMREAHELFTLVDALVFLYDNKGSGYDTHGSSRAYLAADALVAQATLVELYVIVTDDSGNQKARFMAFRSAMKKGNVSEAVDLDDEYDGELKELEQFIVSD